MTLGAALRVSGRRGGFGSFVRRRYAGVGQYTKVVTATRTVAAEQGRPRIESNRLSASIIHEKWVYCTDTCLVSNVA